MRIGDTFQLFRNPGVAAGEELCRGLLQNLRQVHAQNTQAGGVAGGDALRFIERDHRVRHRLQHRLVVVLHVLHVGKQLGVFQRNRNLCREGAQARFIFAGKGATALVQHLCNADHLAVLVDDGHAQDRAGEIAGLLVESRIEAQISVCVRYIDGLARGEHGTGDTQMIGQADLHRLQTLADFRPQLVGLFLVEEQRRALGIQQARCLAHDLLQQGPQLDVGGDF